MDNPLPAETRSEAARTLRARARALAAAPPPPASAAIQVLEFRLAQERYAIETPYLREVCPLRGLTPLPATPPFLRGIVSVRGRILPLIDVKRFFDLPEQGVTDLHRILVVEGHGVEIGLLADAMVSVRSIPVADLQASLPTLTGIRSDYLKGVTADRLVVLDVARVLADPRVVVHDEVD